MMMVGSVMVHGSKFLSADLWLKVHTFKLDEAKARKIVEF